MVTTDTQYQALIRKCFEEGDDIETRNSKVKRIVGEKLVFTSTPLVNVRVAAWKNVAREVEWVLSGSNNINDLHPKTRHWWQPWSDSVGCIWATYGQQLRHYGSGFDQIEAFVKGIKEHPYSRRHVITTWHTSDMYDTRTPITNCWGTLIQAVVKDNRLTLFTTQRSADVVCGLPHNWLQLTMIHLWLCHRTNLIVDKLIWIGVDVHLYSEHFELAKKILEQEPQESPTLCYAPTSEEFKAEDFYLDGEYKPKLKDKAVMVV